MRLDFVAENVHGRRAFARARPFLVPKPIERPRRVHDVPAGRFGGHFEDLGVALRQHHHAPEVVFQADCFQTGVELANPVEELFRRDVFVIHRDPEASAQGRIMVKQVRTKSFQVRTAHAIAVSQPRAGDA